jgi:hypothetical protein
MNADLTLSLSATQSSARNVKFNKPVPGSD